MWLVATSQRNVSVYKSVKSAGSDDGKFKKFKFTLLDGSRVLRTTYGANTD
jgi:hypothetical protein